MAINFDALSNSKGYNIPEPGTYLATIESAEMKQGKDVSKPMYLNVKYKLTNKDGKSVGTIFDILTESEHQLMQYKLKRFLLAIGISFEGEFELKDISKLCVGKQLIVDVKKEEAKDNMRERAVVDLFTGDIFYNIKEAKDIFGEAHTDTINADDAEDAAQDVIDEF